MSSWPKDFNCYDIDAIERDAGDVRLRDVDAALERQSGTNTEREHRRLLD